MKRKVINVERLKNSFVSSNCVLDTIRYINNIALFGTNGLIYYDDCGIPSINQSLEDERKTQFPDFDADNFIEYENKKSFFSIEMIVKASVNQILDIGKPYISITKNSIVERFVVKDNKQALLVKNKLLGNKVTKYMTCSELLKYVDKKNELEKIYYINPNNMLFSDDCFSQSYSIGPENMLFEEVDFRIGEKIFIIRISNEEISVQCLRVLSRKKDICKVEIYDFPVMKYTLEQVKYLIEEGALSESDSALEFKKNNIMRKILIANVKNNKN